MASSQSKVVKLSNAAAREDEHMSASPESAQVAENKDYFVERDGLVYAGSHLIVDLWGAQGLSDVEHIEAALREAIVASNATLLHIHLHQFGPNEGVSGVAVLAESHISIHTWPEREYAAIDIFMCGGAEPARAIPVLKQAFQPKNVSIGEHKRGVI